MDTTLLTRLDSLSVSRWRHFALVLVMDAVVMLADTDASSVITAAQSECRIGMPAVAAG
jgi:hypothetical protein